jgi:hypothetical protein
MIRAVNLPVRDREVGGSNPLAPIFLAEGKKNQRADKELKAPPALRGSAMVARPTRPQIFAVN